jgi:hypothetical protein
MDDHNVLNFHHRVAVLNIARARGNRLAYPPKDEEGRQLLLMMGLPCSGKTSFVKANVPDPKIEIAIKKPEKPKELDAVLEEWPLPPNTTVVIDLKKIIAYSSVAHMNFALLGC